MRDLQSALPKAKLKCVSDNTIKDSFVKIYFSEGEKNLHVYETKDHLSMNAKNGKKNLCCACRTIANIHFLTLVIRRKQYLQTNKLDTQINRFDCTGKVRNSYQFNLNLIVLYVRVTPPVSQTKRIKRVEFNLGQPTEKVATTDGMSHGAITSIKAL